ncbi:MAG: rRNA pseudouridine synthase [Clostridia bacterium]|nr:rRNA pseudouridine synthase [Clostridia bacterium]
MDRLQKVLARRGVASRRKCEDLILAGKVAVNGKIVTRLGTKVDENKDCIEVEGRVIGTEKKVYIALNKPRGYISTVSDPRGRKTVMDLIGDIDERVYPVGRLDYNSQGLLLMTNDGDLAYKVTHPSCEVKKTYEVSVVGTPTDRELDRLRKGVSLEDGITAPARVRIKSRGRISEIIITIHEGRKRQVRRMFQAVGYRVINLCRIQVGNISLGGIPPGKYKIMSENEITEFKKYIDSMQ